MTDQGDDPETAVQRLEAALERIARLSAEPVPGIPATGIPAPSIPATGIPATGIEAMGAPATGQGGATAATTVEMPPDVVNGLDALIENLRAALGCSPGDRPD